VSSLNKQENLDQDNRGTASFFGKECFMSRLKDQLIMFPVPLQDRYKHIEVHDRRCFRHATEAK